VSKLKLAVSDLMEKGFPGNSLFYLLINLMTLFLKITDDVL
jgi:hypothetical protein